LVKKNELDIRIGTSCNNYCLFCVNNDCDRQISRPFDDLIKDIDFAEENKIDKIVLTGGEPTLLPEINQIISYAKEKGIKHIGIYTNARLLSYKDFTKKIVKSGLNWCLTSLHCSDKNIHEKLTQTKDSFTQTISGIKNIVNSNIPVVNNTTITKLNYKQIPETAELLIKLGIRHLHFTFVDPVGNAWKNRNIIVPKYSEVIPFLQKAITLCKKNKTDVTVENIPHCALRENLNCIREVEFPDINLNIVGINNKVADFNKERIKNKYKKLSCISCKHVKSCEGIRKKYALIHGDSEFKPILTKDHEKKQTSTFTDKSKYLVYELAFKKCNNNCISCVADWNEDFTHETTEQILNKINGLPEHKKIIGFTFGEPTIRPDFFEIINKLVEKGKTIQLLTNARMFSSNSFTSEFANIHNNHKDNFKISATLYGHSAKLHDSITRVNSSFDQSIAGIINLIRYNIMPEIRIVINKINYNSLDKIANFLKKQFSNYGLDITFINIDIIGNALINKENVFVNYPKIKPKIQKAVDILQHKFNLRLLNFPHCTLDQLYQKYAEGLDIDPRRIKYIEFCNDCSKRSACQGILKSYLRSNTLSEFKPIMGLPEEVKIELIQECNKECDFCFNNTSKTTKNHELSIQQLKKAIDKVSKANINSIRFTGGEPLLRKDLNIILKYAKQKNLYIILNTNGTLLQKKQETLKNVDEILLSVHYTNELKEKANIINLIKSKGVFLRACTIATKQNIKTLEKFYDFFAKNNVDEWFLLRPVPNIKNKTPITRQDIKHLTEKVITLNKKHNMNIFIANSIPFCSYIKRKLSSICIGGRNDNGHTRIVIDAFGNIKPNYFSSKILGNIKKDNILDSWHSKYLKRIRNYDHVPEHCKKCYYLYKCKAGLYDINAQDTTLDPLIDNNQQSALLINPEYNNFSYNSEPLGISYMAQYLEDNNVNVRIFDCNNKTNNIFNFIASFNPSVIGISCITNQAENAYKLGNIIKKKHPQIKLVYGGVHPTFFKKEPFEKGKADFVVNSIDPSAILSIIQANKKKEKCDILSLYHSPAYHLLNIECYNSSLHIQEFENNQTAEFLSSLGCSMNCSFCSIPSFYGKKIIFLPIKNIIDNIKHLKQEYNISQFHIHDDNFLQNKKRVIEFCNTVIKEKLNIKWICLSGIDKTLTDNKLVSRLKKSGCVGIEIGLESADANVLNTANKKQNITNIKIIEKINNTLAKNNILPLYLRMSFNPGETLQSITLTTELLQKLTNKIKNYKEKLSTEIHSLHLPYYFGQFATPNPGSNFYKTARKQGILFAKTWNDYNHQFISFIPNSFLDDIPKTNKKKLTNAEFAEQIEKINPNIEFYIKNNVTTIKSTTKFQHLMFNLYKIIDNKTTIRQIANKFPESQLKDICICFGFIAMLGLANSK